MPKKPLKVQPARRIYTPKYPSYLDKNPLLYPETRPYPFSHKFIKWASTGGLTSILLLGANGAVGQTSQDTLYNPFPLENARVPYQPVMFGTGMAERFQSEEARQAIRKAFADSGIRLEEKVWLEEGNVGVYLDGYSREEEIGFLFIDYTNMDDSFVDRKSYLAKRKKKFNELRFDLKEEIDWHQQQAKKTFLRFVKNKKEFVNKIARNNEKAASKKYEEQLMELPPTLESEERFNAYYLQYELGIRRANFKKPKGFTQEVVEHIDTRLGESVENHVLFRYANTFNAPEKAISEFGLKLQEKFEELKKIESNEDFIEEFLMLYRFKIYKGQLHKDPHFIKLKMEVMDTYPVKKWFKNLEKIDDYYDRKFVSLSEAKRIDRKNKKGEQFIAPISLRDPLMVIPSSYFFSKELEEERNRLHKEYKEKNGLTKEILDQKQADLLALYKKYDWSKMKDLPKPERDSLIQAKKEEQEAIKAKYKAMEMLSEEEKAAYMEKFEALQERANAENKAHAEKTRIEGLRKLEEEVKRYIQWARSQMGG